MAMIWYAADGTIIRILRDAERDSGLVAAGPPDGAAGMLEFDETTNPTVLAALLGGVPGVLTQDCRVDPATRELRIAGQAVPLAAPSEAWTERRQVATIVAGLRTYLSTSTPTAAQTAAACRLVIRLVLIVGRIVLRELQSP